MTTGNDIVGTSGNDHLYGDSSDDTIDGGAGADTLDGGAGGGEFGGNDTYIFGKSHGKDRIVSNHQTREPYDNFGSGCIVQMTSEVRAKDVKLDIVKVMIGQEDAPDAPQWNLKITLKSSKDVLTIEDYLHVGANGRGVINFADGTSWTYADIVSKLSGDRDLKEYVKINGPLKSYVAGHSANDTLTGTSAAEYIDGSAGNDSISALGGNDSVFGGLGNDTIDAGAGDDYVRDDLGNNVVAGGAGNDRIVTGDGNDSVSGGDGEDNISSTLGSDTVSGGDGNDYIVSEGGAGTHSTLLGDAGNDHIEVAGYSPLFATDVGFNLLDGGDGDDDLAVYGVGASTLVGGAGNDQLTAGTFHEGLISSAVLDGGAGNDMLRGYYGDQTFVFGLGYGFDTIQATHDDRANYYNYKTGLHAGDKVEFGSIITAADITLDIVQEHQVYNSDPIYTQTWWHLDLTITGTTDTLRVQDYLTKNPADVGVITFADGTSWSYADVLSMVANDVDTLAFNDYVITLTGAPAAHSADLFGA